MVDISPRARHVKCDEQKPTCLRCRQSRHRCDGYLVDGRQPSPAPIQIIQWQPNTLALYRISASIAGNEEERQAFQFFRERSATAFQGLFNSSFWGKLVLQAGHAVPSIRHAMFALGSLHRTSQHSSAISPRQRRTYDPFALQQCNKAIGHLHEYILSNGRQSYEILLMSCAIFICFESLQGNYESALGHMQSGLRIYRSWQADVVNCGTKGMPDSSQYRFKVDGEIVQMFSRLNIQTFLFPDTHLFPVDFMKQGTSESVDSVKNEFADLNEAREWLDICVSYQLQTEVAAYFKKQDLDNDALSGLSGGTTSSNLLFEWAAVFDAFVRGAGLEMGSQDFHRANVLRIKYDCVRILLSVGIPPRETAFDDFEDDFEIILFAASSILAQSDRHISSGHVLDFSFEIGILPALYFVATRCRNPWIRRQALSLLSASPMQECIWNSEMLSRIAERLIIVEEGLDEIGEVTRSKGPSVTSRLTVLNATIHSYIGQVQIECYQQSCDSVQDVRLLEEWVSY